LVGYDELQGNPLAAAKTAEVDPFDASSDFCSSMGSRRGEGAIQDSILETLQLVEYGRFLEFHALLTMGSADHEEAVTTLWASFAEILSGSRYSRTWFEVVDVEPKWPAPQTVMATDDQKLITATVANGRDLPTGAIAAELRLAPRPAAGTRATDVECESPVGAPAAGIVTFQAISAQVQPGTSAITLSFPSPTLLGIQTATSARGCVVLTSNSAIAAPWNAATRTASSSYEVVVQPKTPNP
jgi:hypothetical protein